jgi:DNA polymerase-1
MFMLPWLEMARESQGLIFTNWNQVRQSHGADSNVGARTGRLSSNPNFQNISKDFEAKDDGYRNPKFLKRLPPLPLMREYIVPDEGDVWAMRDANQQELRMLAHFEDGAMAENYRREPRFDIHSSVQEGVLQIAGLTLTRSGTKILNFSDIYGKGLANLAESLGVDLGAAKAIRAAKNALMPGVAALTDAVKRRGIDGLPVRTWGGREYYSEESAFSKKFGRVMDFHYKLLNYIVQGSSADMTKEAVIRYAEHPQRRARFLLTVHDELDVSVNPRELKPQMKILQEAIEEIPGIGVPMLSDGRVGKNWGSLEKYVD